MGLTEILLIIITVLVVILTVLTLTKKNSDNTKQSSEEIIKKIDEINNTLTRQQSMSKQEITQAVQESVKNLGEMILANQRISSENQLCSAEKLEKNINEKQLSLQNSISVYLRNMEDRFKTFSLENHQKLENIRGTIETKLKSIQDDTNKCFEGQVSAVEKLENHIKEKQENIQKTVTDSLHNVEERLKTFSVENEQKLENIRGTIETKLKSIQDDTNKCFEGQVSAVEKLENHIKEKQENIQKTVTDSLHNVEERLKTFSVESEQKLENIRGTVANKLTDIQEDTSKNLEQMRNIVEEKMQKTLEERMTKSFSLVNERLEQVYKGLGEMQNLAVNVGDLKKVLTNVKSRGIVGEIQLGAILEEILSPQQYTTNVETKKGSKKVVEYAVKLPGENDSFVYLPIDSKFPGDTYAKLRDAYETGNSELIEECIKNLITTLKSEAKDIHDKYIDPPNTTEFAIMFLPFEGLYAEAVNKGMIEILQREYKVNIAGPSTMASLLNSLQMGFRTLAIQKRSVEIGKVLGAVKTEFNKFADTLSKAQKKIDDAHNELEQLVGTRTRQIQRKLKDITELETDEAINLLETGE